MENKKDYYKKLGNIRIKRNKGVTKRIKFIKESAMNGVISPEKAFWDLKKLEEHNNPNFTKANAAIVNMVFKKAVEKSF